MQQVKGTALFSEKMENAIPHHTIRPARKAGRSMVGPLDRKENMKKMKRILQQIIASTHLDAHGEKNTRDFLDRICRQHHGKRMPLHQQHDMSKETIGYIENFNLVDDESTGESYLKADVYFTCETIDEAMQGFSWSYVDPITPNFNSSEYRLCLPYPLYKDESLITEITSADPHLGIGAYKKKQFDANTVGLLLSGVFFFFGPMWNNTYNEHVVPRLKKLTSQLPKLQEKGCSADLVQVVGGNLKEEIGVHFVPDRGREMESFDTNVIENGLSDVQRFLTTDEKSKSIGIYRIKLYFNRGTNKYHIFHVEYVDGSDINIA